MSVTGPRVLGAVKAPTFVMKVGRLMARALSGISGPAVIAVGPLVIARSNPLNSPHLDYLRDAVDASRRHQNIAPAIQARVIRRV